MLYKTALVRNAVMLTRGSRRDWNQHVTSSCHRINIYSMNRSRPITAKHLQMLEEKGLPIVPVTRPLEVDLESDEDYEKGHGGKRVPELLKNELLV